MKWIPLQLIFLLKKQRPKACLLLAFLFFLVALQAQNVAHYQLESKGNNLFQVNILPDTTYTGISRRITNMQVVISVQTGGFTVSNLTSLINTGQANEVTFTQSSRNNAPSENPQFDYLSFIFSGATEEVNFVKGDTVPLFSFRNGGTCTQDSLYLITPSDPYYFPNSDGANIQQQLTVVGYGVPDAPVGITGENIADCVENCVVEYEVERMTNGTFQVSMTPRETYSGINARVYTMQMTFRIKSDGFEAGNIINLINTGQANEVRFDQIGRSNRPTENPDDDYISFGLQNTNTEDIPFNAGQKVPLFSFNNVGFCTEDTLFLITPNDPYYTPNSDNFNADQQITIQGFGTSDAPVCVVQTGAEDCTKDCYLGCNDNVQVSLGINCQAEVLPEMVATATNLTCPNGPKGVEILENGVVIPTSPFINESHIGRTFQVRVIDSITTNSCWGSIIVKDKTAPVIECRDDTLNCSVQDITPDNPAIGYPLVYDYCTDSVTDLTYKDRYVFNGCATDFSGIIERTWTAVDSAGMVGTCVQNLYFVRQSLDSVIFPLNRDGVEAPIISCADGATDPTNAGAPTIGGDAIYPNIVGVCQLDAGYRDDSVSFCQGNMQIIRTWTVVNACSGAFRTDIQIISVQDTTPPNLICPDTIQASVDVGTCSSTVTFPAATVSDACSGARVYIETPFGTIDGNGGTLGWIPVGLHTITYVAIDSCNNRATCTTILDVADRIAPVAACDFINDVSLRPDGTVMMPANAFDDGSRDGCSGDQLTFLAQRVGDTLDFADYVTFYCADAGDTVNVNLRVTDLSGNMDECVAAIVITNDAPPQITCPPNQTIQCTDDYSDLSRFGAPTIIDDCGGTTNYTVQDSFEINLCGTGRIIRTFSINHGGNVISCEQIITVQNNSAFDGNTIVWPANYTTFACIDAAIHPDSLPTGFNVPTYDSTGVLCNRILRRHSDASFDDITDPQGCYTVLRTWEIIDWCTFNPNDTAAGGYWRHVQQIDLINSIAPTFTNCPSDYTVNASSSTCDASVLLSVTATDDCTPANLITYTYSVDLDSDGIVNWTGNRGDTTTTFPTGVHQIRITASDDCGNSTNCSFALTVSDNTEPTLILDSVIDTFNVMDNGDEFFATVNPNVLATNSTDGCTENGNLTFYAIPSTFSCSQEGLNQILVIVEDEAGNRDSAYTNVFISDINNHCPGNRTAVSISGIIVNEMGERVEQVEVSINHPDVKPSMTNSAGEFSLRKVPVGNDYTILPLRDFDPLNGISTFDLVLISRHILGLEQIKSPYRLIAADVNRSGTITAYDIVQLRQLILRLITEFPNNSSWRFVRGDFEFKHPKHPMEDYFPEVYNINDLSKQDMEIAGFVAVKVGDVNNSATTLMAFTEGESRNAKRALKLNVEAQPLKAGTMVEIPVKASHFNQLLGFQFAFDLDPTLVEILDVVPNQAAQLVETNFGLEFLKKGILTTSWERPILPKSEASEVELFTLKISVKQDTKVSDVLRLNQDFMKAEAYQVEGEQLDLLDVALTFDTNEPQNGLKLYQNRPNPFTNTTVIGFDVQHKETIQLNILDITGKLVRQIYQEVNVGYNEITINNKDLDGKGLYYYQLKTASAVQTKKMILVE